MVKTKWKVILYLTIVLTAIYVKSQNRKTTPEYYKFLQLNANNNYTTVPDETGDRGHVTYKLYKTFATPGITRKTQFKPSVIDKVCLLIPDEGPCRGKISMYFFDPHLMNCSVFKWGGCQGNGNRFDRLQDCLGTCKSSPGYIPRRPRYCHLTFDYGWCFGAEERWYYDFRYKVCKKTIYSGCGGNKNNFYNREQCDNICRFGSNVGLKDARVKKRGNADGPIKVIIVDPENHDKKGNSKSPAAGRKDFDDVTILPPGLDSSEHAIPNAKDQELNDDADLHANDENSLEVPQILGR